MKNKISIVKGFNHHHFFSKDGYFYEAKSTTKGLKNIPIITIMIKDYPDKDFISETEIREINKKYGMTIEYKISSVPYIKENKLTGNDDEMNTLNHYFIREINEEYDSDDVIDVELMQEMDIPEFLAVSLCSKFKDGLMYSEDEGFSKTVDYDELQNIFGKRHDKRVCKLCKKQLNLMLKKGFTNV